MNIAQSRVSECLDSVDIHRTKMVQLSKFVRFPVGRTPSAVVEWKFDTCIVQMVDLLDISFLLLQVKRVQIVYYIDRFTP